MPRNILITGATSGIGLELARQYADNGDNVGICGRDLSKLPSEFLNHHKSLRAYECDVTDKDQLHNAVRSFASQFGDRLDIMIANAGISVGAKSKFPNFEKARRVINVNVIGAINSFEIALHYMLQQKSGQLVGISSLAGLVGLPGASAYSASKSAILKLCESYNLDFKDEGIRSTCICPGFIRTPLTDQNDHPMPFYMELEEGVSHIKYAIETKKHLYIFPWQMKIIMYFLEKMPRSLYRFVMSLKIANYSRGDRTEI